MGDATTDEELDDEVPMSPDLPPEDFDPFEGGYQIERYLPGPAGGYGDFDGDGASDFIVSYVHWSAPPTIEVFRYDPESVSLELILSHDYYEYHPVNVPGWVDDDGQLDIIGSRQSTEGNYFIQMAAHGSSLDIGPTLEIRGDVLGSPTDFDEDGRSDIVVATSPGVFWVHTVDQMLGWTRSQVFYGEFSCAPEQGSWHELTADDRLDLLLVGRCNDEVELTIYAQAEDGSLQLLEQHTVDARSDSEHTSVFAADFDDDGRLDLFIDAPDETTVLAVRPDGTLGDELLHLPYGIGIVAADLDGDGVDEPVVTYGGELDLDGSPALIRVDGDELVTYPVGIDWVPKRAADLNGDGCEDLILSEYIGIFEEEASIQVFFPPCE